MNRILIFAFTCFCISANAAFQPNPATTNQQPNVTADIATVAGLATNATTATNIVGTYFHLTQTIGTTNQIVKWNSTNNFPNDANRHILVNGSAFLQSTDNAFAGVVRGSQLEFTNVGQQIMIVAVLNANLAIGYQPNHANYSYPGVFPAYTNTYRIRPPLQTWTDDTIGAENFGGWQDDNGSFWLCGINDQGTVSFIDFANQRMASIGLESGNAIGFSSSEAFLSFNGMATNSFSGSASAQDNFMISTFFPNEGFVCMSNGIIAVGGGGGISQGFTNRHPVIIGNYIPFWNAILATNRENGQSVQLTNGNVIATGSFTGSGSGITNAATSYFTNLVNGATNANNLTRTVQWTIPVAVSAPAATLGSAEIDAQIQRSDGVWVTVADCDIAGGATSIIATNKEILVVTVPSGASMRVTNTTSGTGYVAGLDAGKTNTFTVFP